MTEADDRRVQFDFEIDFANGGGIQGQGFRLDIAGEDIADDALAAYIVRDLRLLMVAETRILNKTIIRERHKRASGAGAAASGAGGRRHTVSLDRPAQLDAVRIDVTGAEGRAIDLPLFVPYDVADKAVLVHTGWDRHWGTERYLEGHPFLTERAAGHLVDEGAALVGIDSPNVDDTAGGARPVHSILLAAGIPVCEQLTRLGALPVDGFRFSAAPVAYATVTVDHAATD